jgi:hypothetical protein
MPYILMEDRPDLASIVDSFPELSDGELNYVFTLLAHRCVEARGLRYVNLNAIVGVFESAKAEFQRRIVAPYENRKIRENGCVSDLEGELNAEA